MLSFGIPPANAISSAKFSFLGTNASGTVRFHKKHTIDYRVGLPLAVFAVVGGVIGSHSVMYINPTVLQGFIGVFMIFILIITWMQKDLGEVEHPHRWSWRRLLLGGIILLFGMVITTVTGGGSAVLNAYILVLVFGENFIHSAGTQSIINDFTLLAITAVFVYNGLIDWTLAIPLFFCNIVGA
jgi:hypothetical protein